ncbi:hypothetical protein STEG23_038105 [Scotinomys teguina]
MGTQQVARGVLHTAGGSETILIHQRHCKWCAVKTFDVGTQKKNPVTHFANYQLATQGDEVQQNCGCSAEDRLKDVKILTHLEDFNLKRELRGAVALVRQSNGGPSLGVNTSILEPLGEGCLRTAFGTFPLLGYSRQEPDDLAPSRGTFVSPILLSAPC